MLWMILIGFFYTHAAEYLYINFQNANEPDMQSAAVTVKNEDSTVADIELDGQHLTTLPAFQSTRIDTGLLKNREAVLINVTSGRVTVHGVHQYKTKEVQYEISDIGQFGRDKYYLTSMMKHPSSCVVSTTTTIQLRIYIPPAKLRFVEILNSPKRKQVVELQPYDVLFISSRFQNGLENTYVSPMNDTGIAVYCGGSYERMQILPKSTYCGRIFNFQCPITNTLGISSCKFVLYSTGVSYNRLHYRDQDNITRHITLYDSLGRGMRVTPNTVSIKSDRSDICCLYWEESGQGVSYSVMLPIVQYPASTIPATQTSVAQTSYIAQTTFTSIAQDSSIGHTSAINQTTSIAQKTSIAVQATSSVQTSPNFQFTSMETTDQPTQNTMSTRRDSLCRCACRFNLTLVNPSSKELKERVNRLRKILSVDKLNLSSTKRQKKSASDTRSSAKGLGFVAISVLCITVMLIMSCDLHTHHVHICRHR